MPFNRDTTQSWTASLDLPDLWSDWLHERRYAGDAAYREVVRQMVRRIRDRVLDAARLEPHMTVADIGTGDGLLALGAISRIGPSLRAYLTDISTPLLSYARQRAQQAGLARQCTFLAGSAEQLQGINDATVDVAMTRAVLAYVADKAAAFHELHRVLKPGGRISLAEPVFRDQALESMALAEFAAHVPEGGSEGFARLLHKWKAAQFPSTEHEMALNPMSNFSERDLVRFAREAGFTEIHLELHIDVRPSSLTSWELFLGVSPHPMAPPLQKILAEQFSGEEQAVFERTMRPLVESGTMVEADPIAYLSAVKSLTHE